MEDNTKNLTDFSWQDEDDFFGVVEEEQVQEEESSEEDDKTKSKEKEQEEENEEFFSDEQSEESDESDEFESSKETKKDDDKESSVYDDLYSDLKDQGIFTIDNEEEESLDADKFFELYSEQIDQQVNDRIEGLFSEMDDDAKAFLAYKRQGGSTEEFFKTYSQGTTVLGEVDIEKETDQDKVIRYQLETEGWEEDDIADRLEFLTENGRKKKFAERYLKRIEDEEEDQKQEILDNQAKRAKQIKKDKQKFKTELKDTLEEAEEINGFSFKTEKDKKEILNFLTLEKHPVSKTRSITSFQKKLGEALKDKDKLLVLAKLLKTDFDMSDFAKNTITKKTRKTKSRLEQRSGLRPKKSGSSNKGKTLAELF